MGNLGRLVHTLCLFNLCIFFVVHGGVLEQHRSPDASTVAIHSFQEAQSILQTCDDQTLVLFDVDDTLISAVDVMARHTRYPQDFMQLAMAKYPESTQQGWWQALYSIMWHQTERFVIEQSVIPMIEELKKRGCMVLALTALASGTFGPIADPPGWRADMLNRFGINFSTGLPDAFLDNILLYAGTSFPCIRRGIVCTNGWPKGEVLGALLDYFKLKPQRILFFDDKLRFIQSVTNECQRRNIPSTAFHYHGAEKLAGTWSTPRALLQLDALVVERRWIPDEQADRMLQGKESSQVRRRFRIKLRNSSSP